MLNDLDINKILSLVQTYGDYAFKQGHNAGLKNIEKDNYGKLIELEEAKLRYAAFVEIWACLNSLEDTFKGIKKHVRHS